MPVNKFYHIVSNAIVVFGDYFFLFLYRLRHLGRDCPRRQVRVGWQRQGLAAQGGTGAGVVQSCCQSDLQHGGEGAARSGRQTARSERIFRTRG